MINIFVGQHSHRIASILISLSTLPILTICKMLATTKQGYFGMTTTFIIWLVNTYVFRIQLTAIFNALVFNDVRSNQVEMDSLFYVWKQYWVPSSRTTSCVHQIQAYEKHWDSREGNRRFVRVTFPICFIMQHEAVNKNVDKMRN